MQLATTSIQLPIFGGVVPRLELEVHGDGFLKKVTVRVNQRSPFAFDGSRIVAFINGELLEVCANQYVDDERAPTGMYNFGLKRENGPRSFVFDYHTYCAYSCKFCFKESEWEILAISGEKPESYGANFQECLDYVDSHRDDFATKYDIVWLCTGSITNANLELRRHMELATALRRAGYREGIYVSQVIPAAIKDSPAERRDYLQRLADSGVSRFNSGIEVVGTERRKELIEGYKATIVFEDYVRTFEDAVRVFGHNNVGSCLLAGIEPPADTLFGLETIAALGVVPSPTVFTPFVVKQQDIEFQYDLDTLIDVHVGFNEIINRYSLPVFSGVFSLA